MYVVLNLKIISRAKIMSISESIVLTGGAFKKSGWKEILNGIITAW
jgi:hypothetical protein